MKCPECGSEHVQYCTATTGGGFSGFDACCGFMLMGPLGLLCGSCGSSVSTHEYWVCHACGNQFSHNAAIRNQEKLEQIQAEADEYKLNKEQLQEIISEKGGYEAIRQEQKEAEARRKVAKDEYVYYLRVLQENSDEEIRNAAIWANDDKISSVLAWMIIIGVVMLFVVFKIGIALLAVGIIASIIVTHKGNQARAVLMERIPGFVERKTSLDEATFEEKRLNKIVGQINDVEKYEREHKE